MKVNKIWQVQRQCQHQSHLPRHQDVVSVHELTNHVLTVNVHEKMSHVLTVYLEMHAAILQVFPHQLHHCMIGIITGYARARSCKP